MGMSDDVDKNRGSLIPSGKREIQRYSSFLVKRGLDLAKLAVRPNEAMFRANLQRNGVYNTKGVHQFNEVKWRFIIEEWESWSFLAEGTVYSGGIESSPIIAAGMVYIGGNDGHLYAIDIETSEEKWEFRTRWEVYSSPAIADGILFFGNCSLHLFALDIQTGNEKWRFKTENGIFSSPVISDGVIYFGSGDGSLYAVR